MRKRPLLALLALLIAVCAAPATAQAQATSPSSPVNLSTAVDFAAAHANPGAMVRSGDARFEVLTGGLVRMEYAPGGSFEDAPTVNAVNRRFPLPSFTTRTANGWLTIKTSRMTLRYKVGSGPFGPNNVTVAYSNAGSATTVSPAWQNACPFDQVCDAGAATLKGGASIATDHVGYHSVAGFIAGLGQANNASAQWQVLGAPAGQATVTVRYANYIGALGGPAPRTIDLTVNGNDVKTLTLQPTASWDDWATVVWRRHPQGRHQHGRRAVRVERQLQCQRRHAVGLPGRGGRAERAVDPLPRRVHTWV